MSPKAVFVSVIAIIILFIIYLSVFTVEEGQRAIQLRLGEIVVDSSTKQAQLYSPGLHFKVPLITRVHTFDVRLQTLNAETSRISTVEQKYVLVDYYVKWKINDLSLYYQRTGGYESRAQELLKQKISGELRTIFGTRTIKEVVAADRENIMNILKQKASDSAKELGISVNDVRIIGIELPKSVMNNLFQRMRTDRQKAATQLRAQGQAEAEAIRAGADATVEVMIAKAKQEAEQTRAAGDALAAKIYSDAYNQNPQFYAFYRSLLAYRQVFKNKDTVMVLKPDSDFFRYFVKTANGNQKPRTHTASLE